MDVYMSSLEILTGQPPPPRPPTPETVPPAKQIMFRCLGLCLMPRVKQWAPPGVHKAACSRRVSTAQSLWPQLGVQDEEQESGTACCKARKWRELIKMDAVYTISAGRPRHSQVHTRRYFVARRCGSRQSYLSKALKKVWRFRCICCLVVMVVVVVDFSETRKKNK